MRRKQVLAIILTAVLCISGNLWAYSGGNGSATTPFQISTLGHWQTLMNTPTDWNKHFILMANLNFGGLSLIPVGNDSTEFTAVFDGNGHIISNAVINLPSSDFVGLFGNVGSGGQIRKLGVEDFNVTGGSNVGGLVGRISGSLTACYATGTVTGTYAVGGLVGYKGSGVIASCYARCAVSGVSSVGGLAGSVGAPGGVMLNCYSAGAVSGNSYVGSLVGVNYAGLITACFWDTQTSGQATSDGGTGMPTAAMQDSGIYLRAFWDFKGEVKNGISDYWAMPAGGGYPVLAWQVDNSPVSNDEMNNAIAVPVASTISGTSIGATGLDLTQNGYKDSADVWYYFDCTSTGKYTLAVQPTGFNSTLGVFDAAQYEIVFNDDFFGEKSVVILNAAAGQRYYIRVAGYNGQTGNFTLTLAQGAIQAIQGDLNYDGMVNLVDFSIMAENWLLGM